MQETRTALQIALSHEDEAAATFAWMNDALKNEFVHWIKSASDQQERARRLKQSVEMLAGREPLRRQ